MKAKSRWNGSAFRFRCRAVYPRLGGRRNPGRLGTHLGSAVILGPTSIGFTLHGRFQAGQPWLPGGTLRDCWVRLNNSSSFVIGSTGSRNNNFTIVKLGLSRVGETRGIF